MTELIFFNPFQVVPTVYTDINDHIILSNQVISFSFPCVDKYSHDADVHVM